MGTTLDAMLAGSHATVYVVAIEGYPYLLTNGDPDAAVIAWAAHGDYALALGGLTVELDNEQAMDPWEPFQGGGKCLLRVVDETGADTFGIDTHRKGGGFSTQLTATIGRDDTTVPVKNTLGWPSSGTAYVGSEALAYTGVTSTDLTGVTRGKWSPMWRGDTAPVTTWARFARTHRVGNDANSLQLQPVVSTQPRVWDGKLATVWAHRVSGGVLDVVAEAQCVYAGTVAEITDDGKATVVHLRHVLDLIKDASLGHDTWSAKVPAGFYLHPGMKFQMRDRTNLGVAYLSAINLTVVAGTPSGNYQVKEGIYTLDQILERINRWMSAALIAGNLNGTHSMAVAPIGGGELRTKLYSNIPGVATNNSRYELRVPLGVAILMGFSDAQLNDYQGISDSWLIYKGFAGGVNVQTVAPEPPKRAAILDSLAFTGAPFDLNKVTLYDEQGEFFDQLAFLPEGSTPADDLGLAWGIFLFDSRFLVFAAKDDAALGNVLPTRYQYAGTENNQGLLGYNSVPLTEDAPDYFEIRQVLILEMAVIDLLRRVLCSTGTAGYNGTHDALPYAGAVGLPGGLLKNLGGSAATIPGGTDPIAVVIDKPVKLSTLLGADLVIRRAFPVWRNGGIQMGTWKRPDASAAVATLDEDNKAAAMGTDDDHRNASTQTDAWKRPIIKINYNRDLKNLEDNGYKDSITIKDRVSIDDSGGDVRMVTLDARNTFGQIAATGTSIEALIPTFLPALELFTRSAWLVTRTINPALFEALTIGDVVLVDDAHARDPITGARGIGGRPALVIKHRASPGGLTDGDGDPTPPGGEVTLLFSATASTLLSAVYAPAADVDSTYAAAGYTAGYNASIPAIYCHAARYSQTIEYYVNGYPVLDEEAADATHFDVGDEVVIVQRDPYDAASPLSWRRTVTAQSGNTITLSSALTGFDTALKYTITFADYNYASTIQRTGHVYQADDADNLILDTYPSAYVYTTGTTDLAYQANSSTEVELPPTARTVDGAARDVWTDAALARLADNLHDYKTSRHGARFFWSEIEGTTESSGDLKLVAQWPVFLTLEQLTTSVQRLISVAPVFRSEDGATALCRISLSRTPVFNATNLNVTIPSPFSFVEFSTDLTTYEAHAPLTLVENVKQPGAGVAWLQIQLTNNGVILGLARCVEGIRYTP